MVGQYGNPMRVYMLIFFVFFTLYCSTQALSSTKDKSQKKPETTASLATQKNCTNTTSKLDDGCPPNNHGILPDTYFSQLYKNKTMLMRAFYVVLTLTIIVAVYFVFRAWKLRRHRNKSRKYGIITTPAADVEMQPLDEDDDDDDMTLFEVNGRAHRKSEFDC